MSLRRELFSWSRSNVVRSIKELKGGSEIKDEKIAEYTNCAHIPNQGYIVV